MKRHILPRIMGVLAGAAVAAALASWAPAAAEPDPTVDVTVGESYETLTNNLPDWKSTFVHFVVRNGDGPLWYGGVEETSQFGKWDSGGDLGIRIPMSAHWHAIAEAAASTTHFVLPVTRFAAGIEYGSGAGWYETLRFQNTQYTSASVNAAALTVERYWGRYRAAYTATVATLAFTGTDVEHAVTIDRTYGSAGSHVGVTYQRGREVESIGLPNVATLRVEGIGLQGRQWIRNNWAIDYSVETFTAGASYTRTGGSLGLHYRF